tara:strand:- start:264 stop:1205 length:942 start_codon:yes stop_codon:yes gene_type:complete
VLFFEASLVAGSRCLPGPATDLRKPIASFLVAIGCHGSANLIPPALHTLRFCHSEVTLPPLPEQPHQKSTTPISVRLLIGVGVASGLCVIGVLTITLYSTSAVTSREAARLPTCQNNLQQLGLALANYHEAYGTFPPAYIPDETGRPMHSWRVLVLPFLDRSRMYDAYDFDKPWNHADNLAVTQKTPQVFRCPSAPPDGQLNVTHYVYVTGPDTCFDGAEAIRIQDITDGQSQTILVVETHQSSISWNEPRDLEISRWKRLGVSSTVSSTSDHATGFHVVFADGSVRFIQQTVAPRIFKAMTTPRGGENLDRF